MDGGPGGRNELYGLERLLEGTNIEFQGPGRSRLTVEGPECFGDVIDGEHSVGSQAFLDPGKALVDDIAVDDTVDHDVSHVKALGAEFSGHPESHGAQRRLGGGEGGEGETPPGYPSEYPGS